MMTDEAFAETLAELFLELRKPPIVDAIKRNPRILYLVQLLDVDLTERLAELTYVHTAPDKDGGRG